MIALLWLLHAWSVPAAGYNADTVIIPSVILNEPREIVIYRPAELAWSDSVSFVYLLDGEYAQYRYERIIGENFGKPVMGIAILNVNRNRDMLPAKEPDKFLAFIQRELIPIVEKNYPRYQRILYGHSFAGGFTLYAMIRKPGLFDKYIASSPTPIMEMVACNTYLQLDRELPEKIKFYFGYGSKDMKQVREWGAVLQQNLSTVTLSRIHWKNEIHEGENHQTSAAISLINGMKF